jgi:hypothetical protein
MAFQFVGIVANFLLKYFFNWWAHGNLYENFFELGPQKGKMKIGALITFSIFNISLKYDFTP